MANDFAASQTLKIMLKVNSMSKDSVFNEQNNGVSQNEIKTKHTNKKNESETDKLISVEMRKYLYTNYRNNKFQL